jgi:epidermal growth factor receptor substrate 15
MDKKNTPEIGSEEKTPNQTRITLNFKTESQKIHFNEQIELVAKKNDCNKNNALNIITNLLEKQLAAEGYGKNEQNFVSQYYSLLEMHANDLLREFKRALQNCEKSISAIKSDRENIVDDLNEKIKDQESAHEKIKIELTQKNDELINKIKKLAQTNQELIEKNNVTEAKLKNLEKLVAALENERDLLKKENSESKEMVKKAGELLKKQESLVSQIESLKSDSEKLENDHQLKLKECELAFEKKLNEKIASVIMETENKVKNHYDQVVADLKKMLSENLIELKAERKNVETVRSEERNKAEKRIKQLEDQLLQAQKLRAKESKKSKQ